MKKRLLATLLALVMALGLTVTAAAEDVTYLDENGTAKPLTESYTTVTSGTTTWGAGWYVVKESVEVNGQVQVTGDVKLLLYDGATLTVKVANGTSITIKSGSLTVYGQSNQSGTLNAESSSNGAGSGIGGSITVNSGKVTAHGGYPGCGIAGNVTVNGGWVEVYGRALRGIQDNATVTAGYLYVQGTDGAQGIHGSVTIEGGTVIAESNYAACIEGSVTPPTCYKWRTGKGETAYTESSTELYNNSGKSGYVEIVACHALGDWVPEIPATCMEDGTKGHKDCSICGKHFDSNGKEITDLTIEKDPNNHAEDGVWHSDRKTHWMTYDACCNDETEKTAHSFDGRTCTVCGYKKPSTSGSTATTVTETTTVASPKTADAGVLLSGALSVASLLGMGYVGKKR